MPFTEAITIALTSLSANKLRSFLTVLGILIGVSSVIAVVAITDGLDRYISDRVLQLGSKSFSVQKMPDVITSRDQWREMMKRKDLTLEDYQVVKKGCPACSDVGAMLAMTSNAKWGRTLQENVRIIGITENFPRIGSVRDIVVGRPLIPDDIEQVRPVAVIGSDLVEAFFGGMEPLGKEILVTGRPVKVVGAAEKKGTIFGQSQDNFVWIPISTFRKFYGSRRSVLIQAEAWSMSDFETAQDQARVAMRVR